MDLSKMKLPPEMIEKIEDCTTPEELVKLAKDNGVVLSLEEAKEFFDNYAERDLPEEELDKVAGGIVYPCKNKEHFYPCERKCVQLVMI